MKTATMTVRTAMRCTANPLVNVLEQEALRGDSARCVQDKQLASELGGLARAKIH